MTMHGLIRGCAMPIMYLRNKCGCFLGVIAVSLLMSGPAFSGAELERTSAHDGRAQLGMADKSVYSLTMQPGAHSIAYDKHKHMFDGKTYIAVFQASASNPGKPMGFCGAGSETWLYVYAVDRAQLFEKLKVQVGSCLQSFSLASQNTGEPDQAFDFSSVQWTPEGFSIDWFNKSDAAGRAINTTRYTARGAAFIPFDVVNSEPQDK